LLPVGGRLTLINLANGIATIIFIVNKGASLTGRVVCDFSVDLAGDVVVVIERLICPAFVTGNGSEVTSTTEWGWEDGAKAGSGLDKLGGRNVGGQTEGRAVIRGKNTSVADTRSVEGVIGGVVRIGVT
jgi:hypothetical protein